MALAQICEYDLSNVTPTISMETQVPKERTNISWTLRDISELCPPGVEEFDRIASPEFSVGASVGKPSTWEMHVSGDKGFISFGLNLLNLDFPSANISGSASVILKNAEGKILNVTRVQKFKLGRENTSLGIRKFTSIANIWTGRTNFEIPNALHFEIVVDLHGDPVSGVSKRGVKRSASKQLTIEDVIEDDQDKILVECEGQRFPVHKSILSAKSKRFAAMLSPGSAGISQRKLQLHDLDSATAGTLFSFIYNEKLPESLSVDEARNVLGAAKTYEVKDMISKTFSVLCEDLTTDNYSDILALYKEYGGDSETKKLLDSFYKQNRRVLNRLRRS